jgi:pilus assembly protein CpaF
MTLATFRETPRGTSFAGLQPLVDDPEVKEIIVNNNTEVWAERTSGLERAGSLLPGEASALLERLLAPLGRRIDLASPVVDARLPDGSRLCAAIPPVSPHGLCLTIRRFSRQEITLSAFCSSRVSELLASAIHRRQNIIVAGATSTGKTTLLGALAAHVNQCERIVVLEDTNELVLQHPHAIYLESRPSSAEGLNDISLSHLVRHALRLRPDRLVVGEVRGAEAFDMLQAMNTGHTGSMSTCHANSALDALHRIETMVLQATPNWPLGAVRSYVASAIDLVVHLERSSSGRRYVVEVVEVADVVSTHGAYVTSRLASEVDSPQLLVS